MEVNFNGKTLYHIQNMNICSDGSAFDDFVWADHYPTEADLLLIWEKEFGQDETSGLDEFLTSSEIYKVYAEEL